MKLLLCVLLLCFVPSCHAVEITEIFPAPESGEEWVEIYNNEGVTIDISEYSIYDLTGKKMNIKNFFLNPDDYTIATAEGVLNNSGDTIFFADGLDNIIDTITFPVISSNQAYTKCGTEWRKSTETSQKSNNLCEVEKNITTTPILPTKILPSTSYLDFSISPTTTVALPTYSIQEQNNQRKNTKKISFGKKHKLPITPKPTNILTTPEPTAFLIESTHNPTSNHLRYSTFLTASFGTIILFGYLVMKITKNKYND